MNRKRFIRLLILWLSTFLMGGIVSVLIYVQMAVNQENIVGSLEIESPEVEADSETKEPVSEDVGPEP